MTDKIRRPVRRGVARVPVVMQLEALECGAACLCMILARYKKWIPLEQMREDCGVSRDGSNALNMVKAAREVAAQPIDDEALSRVSGGYDACWGEHSRHYILRHDEGDPDDPDHACFHNDLCLAVFTEACRQSPACTNNYRDLNKVAKEIKKRNRADPRTGPAPCSGEKTNRTAKTRPCFCARQ